VRDAIADLPEQPGTTELPVTTVEVSGRRVAGPYKRLDLHFGRRPRELSLRRYDCGPPAAAASTCPTSCSPRCWREKPTGTTDVMGRMRWDQPSLTDPHRVLQAREGPGTCTRSGHRGTRSTG
jgi:DNA (cytosine-5)-methyltransferase 1